MAAAQLQLPPIPPGWNMGHLQAEYNQAMASWNPNVVNTRTDRDAVRRVVTANACRCGTATCAKCKSPMRTLIASVLRWYLTLGLHNHTLQRDSRFTRIFHVYQAVRAMGVACIRHRLLSISQDTPQRNRIARILAEFDLVCAISDLFLQVTSNPLPPTGISYAGLFKIAYFQYRTNDFSHAAIHPSHLASLLNWTRVQLSAEPMNALWLQGFRRYRYETLLVHVMFMLGEIFFRSSVDTLFFAGHDQVIEAVLLLLWSMTRQVFINAYQAHIGIHQMIQRAQHFADEVLNLLRLLRLHRDANATRPNIVVPINWPCNYIYQTVNQFQTLPGLMHTCPVAFRQIGRYLADRVDDIFLPHPQLTARRPQKEQMVQVVSAVLNQMPSYSSVRDAVTVLAQLPHQQFSELALTMYFCSAKHD